MSCPAARQDKARQQDRIGQDRTEKVVLCPPLMQTYIWSSTPIYIRLSSWYFLFYMFFFSVFHEYNCFVCYCKVGVQFSDIYCSTFMSEMSMVGVAATVPFLMTSSKCLNLHRIWISTSATPKNVVNLTNLN
jgi:hypothetical protein